MADAPYHLTVKELVTQSYENSAAHGFWESERTDETIPSKLALIHSEISEALESFRDPNADEMVKVPIDLLERLISHAEKLDDDDECNAVRDSRVLVEKWKAKPKGFAVELADAFIRLADLCGAEGIDIEQYIRTKHTYNIGREHRHGRRV